MKLGAQLYNVREYTKTPEDIEATLRRIKAMGFNVIQISGFGPCNIDLLAGWVQELNLDVCVTHVPWPRLADSGELKTVIAEHKKLGCSQIGLGMRPSDVFPNTGEGWTRFIKKTNSIIAQVRDAGLGFGYHNHDLEFQKWNGVTTLDRLAAECPGLDFILDTFWVQAGGANPAAYIKKFQGRIKTIHFKDFRVVDQVRQFAEIGQGNIDWDEIIPLCKAQNIPYAVIEQDANFLIDPFESLAMSLAFLKGKV
ncbi:MAG: sugar phosphate isomerase/epimerase [Treponema sp.]|jgi:sugar phosphate isomerase/epimerase|nr:sugar phosphate isomerase/epimerase [Treponema sp.]